MLKITATIKIPLDEIGFTFARSGGPGGQNVNKVNSKALLRWRAVDSPSLPSDVKGRFLSRFANRLTQEGEIILIGQKYRDRGRNIDDCLEKLKNMLVLVAVPPKHRHATKVSYTAKQKRVDAKQVNAKKKQSRRVVRADFD